MVQRILQEAIVTITENNKAKIDDIIHKCIGEQQLRQLLRRLEKSPRINQGKPRDESGTSRQTQSTRLNLHTSAYLFSSEREYGNKRYDV
jgi:hypothetical protein